MRLLEQGEDSETETIVPQEFLAFDGHHGDEERGLGLIPCQHRAGVAVIVVLRIIEGEGEQRACRGITTQVTLVLSRERAAIEVLSEISQKRG